MFNEVYNDWNHKRGKAIIDHYGYRFFYGKKILDLGAGHGELGAMFLRLGAEVTCVDVREENLKEIRKNHPAIKTMRLDLEREWPFAQNQFDVVLSMGLLCHLKNYEQHLKNICAVAECIVLETEVLDITDLNLRAPIYEEKLINDLSFHGEGSIVSANNIQNKLSTLGATFKRFDEPKVNSGPYRYDWRESGLGRVSGNRRFWFIRRDVFIAKKLEIHSKSLESEHTINPPSVFMPPTNSPQLIYYPPTPPSVSLVSSKSKIRLFYNYYEDQNPKRKREIDFCLQKNIDNLLLDIVILQTDSAPTFNFYFEKINKLTSSNDINIICNSDIYFDNTVSLVNNLGTRELYALSCWDWRPYPPPRELEGGISVHRNVHNSQDAWIVRGKVENVDGNIVLGTPFYDSRIAYEFRKAGYNIKNPSKTIKANHFHSSDIPVKDNIGIQPDGPILFIDVSSL